MASTHEPCKSDSPTSPPSPVRPSPLAPHPLPSVMAFLGVCRASQVSNSTLQVPGLGHQCRALLLKLMNCHREHPTLDQGHKSKFHVIHVIKPYSSFDFLKDTKPRVAHGINILWDFAQGPQLTTLLPPRASLNSLPASED